MRKTFSALLMTMLLASGLAACGDNTPASGSATGAPASNATSAPTAPAAGGVALPEVDPMAVRGDIIAAGSSTVFPLTEAMAVRFQDEGYEDIITIDSVGTGAGFERFCVAGETDIANASRSVKDEEAAACQAKGRELLEFRVGTDALAVVVSTRNTFAQNLTTQQLADIFSARVKTWSELDPSYPARPIELFSPGTDSGTFDYFVEAIFKKNKEPMLIANPQLSEDDNVLAQGVAGNEFAIGYIGYAYFEENRDKLRAIPINGIAPNLASAEDGTYPLSRPLYIYTSRDVLRTKPQIAAFINFYLAYVNDEIEHVGYFPASPSALDAARQQWLAATR